MVQPPPPPHTHTHTHSKNVATNIGKKFFTLLSACFPANNKLYKIINKKHDQTQLQLDEQY